MEFVNQSRQAGIFGGAAATRFAGSIRTVGASTGMDQGQLMQLASSGAQVARSFGGRGEQGALGALRGASTMSAALSAGQLSEAAISEATGGRTGQDATSSFVLDMMQLEGRRGRSAHGRYMSFGLSNDSGRGLDQAALIDFQSGNMGTGDLSRRAHRQVGRMGRAQAINREGLLRGAMMEEGGMAGMIGRFRQVVGDRAMDQGDDMMSLVLQRREHMTRPQAEVMTSLIRNQSSIAAREAGDAANSSRESLLRSDIRENRSLDALTRHIEHAVQDGTGMLRARDMGRSLVTRLSSMAERVMNDLLGISSEQMGTAGQQSMNRLRQGSASRQDLANLGMGSSGGASHFDINSRGLLQHGGSVGARIRAQGVSTQGVDTYSEASSLIQRMQAADMGFVSGRSERQALAGLSGDVPGSQSRIMQARLAAMGTGDANDLYRFVGGNRNATAAFMSQQGIRNDARAPGMGGLMGQGAGDISFASVRDHIMTAGRGMGSFLLGRDTSEYDLRDTQLSQAILGPRTDNIDFLAGGGHFTRRTGEVVRAGRQRTSDGRMGIGAAGRTRIAAAEAMHGVSREHLQQLQGNSEFMTRMRAVTGATSNSARTEAMSQLTAYTNNQENDGEAGQFRAMSSLTTQMQDSMSQHGGALGSEFQSFTRDSAAERAANQARQEYAGSMLGMGARSQGRLGRAVRALGTYVGRNDPEQALAAQANMRRTVLSMTPEELRAESNAMMDVSHVAPEEQEAARAFARAQAMGNSRLQAVDRNLRGLGRRRGRGAAETAIGEMTGYGTGDMEFQVRGRTVRGQAGQTMLQRALAGQVRGEDGAAILRQFQEQATDSEGMGLTAQRADEMRGILQHAMGNRGRDGAVSQQDRERIHEFTQLDDVQNSMRDATRRRSENALSSAAGRDPVGARQIQLLESINTGISRMTPASSDAAPNMSTDRNMSGG